MKDKVLCLGCSHLSGAYNKNDAVTSNESWAWHLWKLRNKNESFYTLPSPGLGIMQYGAIVETLAQTQQLKKFRYAIVQLTDEPRINWFGGAAQNHYFSTLNDFVNGDHDFNDGQYMYVKYANSIVLSNVTRKMYEIHEHKFTTAESKNQWLDVSNALSDSLTSSTFSRTIFSVYFKSLLQTLIEHGVKPIVFDWWGRTSDSWESVQHLINDNVLFYHNLSGSVKQTLEKHNLWQRDEQSLAGHMNSNQNKIVAEFINNDINARGLMHDAK